MTLIKFLLNAVIVIAALITIVGNAWILFATIRKIPVSRRASVISFVSLIVMVVMSVVLDWLHWR